MDFKKILFRTNTIDVEKALPDATVFCGKDGKIQWVNDKSAEVFNTSKMHLLTSNISDFIENALTMLNSAITNNSSLIVKKSNEDVFYDMTATELEEGYVFSLRDTNSSSTYKKISIEEDVEVINRNKNNFIIKLANDFRSPLQSIVGFSQAMADGLGGTMSEQQSKYINIIRKNSSDLMYFINKLIELSQTENEAIKPVSKTFDLISCVNTLVKFNEQIYKHKDVKWTFSVDSEIKNTINTDEEILKLILQNIIEVIIKSIDMGELAITMKLAEPDVIQSRGLDANGSYIVLSVASNSLLLTESDLESMFDPYKIIDTANRKNLLRAIILACVKNMIKNINGQVWVESQILKNTSFNIILPQV